MFVVRRGDLAAAYSGFQQRGLPARTVGGVYSGASGPQSRAAPAHQPLLFVNRACGVEGDEALHRALDAAVFRAYGWVDGNGRPEPLTDEQILKRLLALNLAWAGGDG